MKIKFKFQYAVLLLCVMLSIVMITLEGCKKDEETQMERTARLLKSGTWKIDKVTVDVNDKTSSFNDMKLTLLPGTYTAQNGSPVWPASGTWRLIDASTIDFDNGMVVQIDHLEKNSLAISLVWNKVSYGEGREVSIHGKYIFEFSH